MLARRGQVRSGFTLMEVLAVTMIITLILSIMLPALTRSREAARRTSCMNNLRQIALALNNYEYIKGVLPPGVVDRTRPIRNEPDGIQHHIGWITQILPHLEQQRVYETINTNVSVYDPLNLTAYAIHLNTLSCPSDPKAGRSAGSVGGSSYAACHHDVEAPIDVNNHGVFFLNSSIRHDDVLDGSSFTIFVGETRRDTGHLGWMSGTRATLRNTGTPPNAPTPAGDDLVGGFGGYHPVGANFAFGDGSVRVISDRINPNVYRLLGHRADGEPINADAF